MQINVNVNLQGIQSRFAAMRSVINSGTAHPVIRAAFMAAGVTYLGAMRQRYVKAARGDGTWKPLADSTVAGRRRKGDLRGTIANLQQLRKATPAGGKWLEVATKEVAAIKRQKQHRLRTRIAIALKKGNRTEVNRLRRALAREYAKGGAKHPHSKAANAKLPNVDVEILRDTGTLLNSLSVGAAGNAVVLGQYEIKVGTAIGYAQHHQNPTKPGRPPQRKILVAPDANVSRRMQTAIMTGYRAALGMK